MSAADKKDDVVILSDEEEEEQKLDPTKVIFVGVDFGTICSAVYGLRHNAPQPEVWKSQASDQYLLSTLMVNNYDNFSIGSSAAEKPFSTITGNKRILGLLFDEINKADIDNAAYKIVRGEATGLPMYKIKTGDTDQEMTISAITVALEQLRFIYEQFVLPNAGGYTIKLCTTCPAFYTALQRDILYEIRMFIFFC